MPLPPSRPAALRGSIFRGSTAVRSGELTRHQLAGSAWRRLFPDVYACSTLDVTHELRAEAATELWIPGSVASGRTAAVVWGVELAGPDDAVELTVPTTCRARAASGLHLTRRGLSPAEVAGRRGVRVTSPLRTALDLARITPLEEAVVALDRFLSPGLVFLHEVREAAASLGGRDCRHMRAAAELADGLAGSPQETRLRLVLHRSPLPRPLAQYRVSSQGRFVARVDFAWPEQKVALEYEGMWHGERQQVAKDRSRLNALTRAGWRVVFVTAADLRDPARLIARIAEALAASRIP